MFTWYSPTVRTHSQKSRDKVSKVLDIPRNTAWMKRIDMYIIRTANQLLPTEMIAHANLELVVLTVES